MEVILDTNFIVSCIIKKIDFFEHLEDAGFKVLIPKEVILEMKDIRLDVRHDERVAIDLALEMLSDKKIKKIKLGQGKVDDRLVELGRNGSYIASLDAYIRRSVPNRVVIDTRKNGILIERD